MVFKNPNRIPVPAPIIPIITDSVKNKPSIVLFVLPSAFKIPIPCTLITDVYIVIMIPNDSTIRENTAMLDIKVEIPTINLVKVFSISREFSNPNLVVKMLLYRFHNAVNFIHIIIC